MVTVIVMAGGKGTRMNASVEKPLVKVKERYLIDYVLENLESSQIVNKIFIATSPHVPLTQDHVVKMGYDVIKTPGKGYIKDLEFLLSHFEAKCPDETLLTIAADLPLVTGALIDCILTEYQNSSKPAMSVVVPVEIFNQYHLEPSVVWEGIVPSGVNILRSINKIQDEEVLEVPKIELALNINSPQDIKVLERFLVIK